MIVHSASGSGSGTSELRDAIDAAPLPAGATMLGETDNDGHGDTTPRIERRYRLGSATDPTAEIEQVLVASRYRVLDLPTGNLADVPHGSWKTSVTSTTGNVTVLPHNRTGGGIEYLWQNDRLYITVQDGALDGS